MSGPSLWERVPPGAESRPGGRSPRVAQVTARAPLMRAETGRLLLIVLVMLLYPFEYDDQRTNYSVGDALVGPVALGFALWSLVRPLHWPRYVVHVVALVMVALSSALVNTISPEVFFSGVGTLMETVKLLSAAAWMCVVFWLLQRDFPRGFLALACTSTILAAGFALSAVARTLVETTDYRPVGPFSNANAFGAYLVFNVFLVFGTRSLMASYPGPLPLLIRKLRAPLGFVVLPLLLMGMLSTGSRGAMLGCAAGLALAGYWKPKTISAGRLVTFAVGAVLLVLAARWYVAQDPPVLRRLQSTAEGGGPNIESRYILWRAASDAFIANPLLGLGYGQFRNYAAGAVGKNTPAHQTFLSMAAELGLIGLATFIWLVVAVLSDTRRARLRPYPGVTQACRGFVVAALTQGCFTNVQHSRALWITLGVIAIHAVQETRKSSPGRRPVLPASGGTWAAPSGSGR